MVNCRKPLFLALIGAALLLTGCEINKKETSSSEEISETQKTIKVVTDAAEREVEIPEKVERIVCIGVSTLRYTCYMDAEDLVVGVEDYEHEKSISRPYNYVNYDLFAELPVIGVKDEPDPELLLKADPDVIMMSSYVGMDADQLQEKTGIPVITISHNDKMMDETAYNTFRIMGEVYGKQERAEELIEYMNQVKADLESRTSKIPEEEKPEVYVAGVSYKGAHGFEGTEAHYGPLESIHARNLADETEQKGAFNVDLEQVLTWNPDIIFVDFNGMELIREHYRQNPQFYEQLEAVQEENVYSQISYRSSASNLETALADTYYAGTILYPDTFGDIDPAEKADEVFVKVLGTEFYGTLKENGYEFKKITIGEE